MELTVGYYDVEKMPLLHGQTQQIASARPSTTTRCTIRMYIHQARKSVIWSTTTSVPAPRTTAMNMTTTCAAHSNISHHSRVNEFILDLRYNGGLLSCAELLCTMLASAFGTRVGVPGIQQPLQSADKYRSP